MIQSITIQSVASYSDLNPVTINTNKKLSVLYGHNGTGKSTIARYLNDRSNARYKRCSHQPSALHDYQILIYNTDFIERNFSQDSFEGVFTLGKENIDAERLISDAENKITHYESQMKKLQTDTEKLIFSKEKASKELKNKIFEIKKENDKKDLDFCLIGFKGSADKFFDKLVQTPLQSKIEYTLEDLSKEAKELSEKFATKIPLLPALASNIISLEDNQVLEEVIIASNESYLSDLVVKLKNSSWIDQGRYYLSEAEGKCPFCQQELQSDFESHIKSLFDLTYESKKSEIDRLKETYIAISTSLKEQLSANCFRNIKNKDFYIQKEKLIGLLQENIETLKEKSRDPSLRKTLENTTIYITSINKIIHEENLSITEFNSKLDRKQESLDIIKEKFWAFARLKSNAHIEEHNKLVSDIDKKVGGNKSERSEIRKLIEEQNLIVSSNRALITNIDISIENINNQIKSIGLEGFEIKKKLEENNHYYLHRAEHGTNTSVFRTMSEGEKTLITYLYFLELCQGSTQANSSTPKHKKIIVIDDPISSLSHNYIYEIGSLTHKKIIKGYEYSQVILLTHSLYFLHEILKYLPNKTEEFDKKCNLFRVTKNINSNVTPIGRTDIKNDYQSYWQIIKDVQSSGANNIVLPNIMRNILEHYFSFVHKSDELRKTLDSLEEGSAEFSPFFRYINRESHSDSININDLGEIDSERFIEKFREVFVRTNFEEHYEKMMS